MATEKFKRILNYFSFFECVLKNTNEVSILIYLRILTLILSLLQEEIVLRHKKACSNCIKGTAITVNSDILCRDKGAVSSDYVCSKHRFSPLPLSSSPISFKCIDCENFIHEFNDDIDMPVIGLCQLFSVRHFDGKQKSACSKFIKKSKREVC